MVWKTGCDLTDKVVNVSIIILQTVRTVSTDRTCQQASGLLALITLLRKLSPPPANNTRKFH